MNDILYVNVSISIFSLAYFLDNLNTRVTAMIKIVSLEVTLCECSDMFQVLVLVRIETCSAVYELVAIFSRF